MQRRRLTGRRRPGLRARSLVPPPADGCSRHGVMRRRLRRPATRSVSFSPSQTARRTDSNVFYVALLRCLPSLLPAGVITRFHSVYGRESFSLDTSRRAAPRRVPGASYARGPSRAMPLVFHGHPSIHPSIYPSIFPSISCRRERLGIFLLLTIRPPIFPSFLPLSLNSAQNSSRPSVCLSVCLSIFPHPVGLSHGCQPIHTCPFHLLST